MAQMDPLATLHAEIDAAAAALNRRHGERLRCARGCSDCCVDGITVFTIEAERIRSAHPTLLREARPHPPGACAFLDDDGTCRIYDVRPYVCRSEGLPLSWLGPAADGSIVEQRSICPLNEPGTPLTDLGPDDCWSLGPWEGRLAELTRARTGHLERVALRDLFERPPP